MFKASIIVPTRNRADQLTYAIKSFMAQDFLCHEYEILVVDNCSTDNTQKVTENMITFKSGHNIKYLFEPEPGLLAGRHRGSFEAEGEILIFVDDDVEAVSGWLSAIIETFNDPKVHLVGGPSLPKFEVEPPDWLSKFWTKLNGNVTCGPLSISYMGDKKAEVDPCDVWGLNFAIRKKTLFNLGGFHPDCIPKNLQHFQGDGETGLSLKIKEKGLKAIYAPGVLVYHNIPKERLTVSYFEERFYYQGVCDSFTQIRKNGGLNNIALPKYCSIHRNTLFLPAYDRYKRIIYDRTHNAYVDGFLFHQKSVQNSEILLNWVLRENFLNYKLPDLYGKAVKTNADNEDPNQSFDKSNNLQIGNKNESNNLILIVGTAHRVGSTWLFKMLQDLCSFNSHQDLIPKQFFENNTLILKDREILNYLTKLKENFIFKSHSSPVPYSTPPNMKFVTILRDPRDVIVSNCFYLSHLEEENGGWGQEFHKLSDADRIKRLIKEGEFILSRLEQWYKSSNAHKVFYENLLFDPVKEIKTVLKFLGLKKDEDELRRIIEQNSFQSQTGRKPGEEIKKSHIRKGVIGDWKNYFNKECIEAFKESYNGRWNNLLLEMGYERCENWGLTENYFENKSPELFANKIYPISNESFYQHSQDRFEVQPNSDPVSPVMRTQPIENRNSQDQERQSYYGHTKEHLNNKEHYTGLKKRLVTLGVTVDETELDIDEFEKWLQGNPEIKKFYHSRNDVIIEKCLEHYLSFHYLNITQNDIYIDIAAAGSPWVDILNKRGIRSFRLDKAYSRGINGTNIGADASSTNLPDSMFSVLSLHCAYECFMGDVDIKFLNEAGRILNQNGRFVIVPLYLANTFKVITSPFCDQRNVLIDEGAKKVWRKDEYIVPFSRNYSPESFLQRVYSNIPKDMKAKVFYFKNIEDLMKKYQGQRVYSYFMLYCEKTKVLQRANK